MTDTLDFIARALVRCRRVASGVDELVPQLVPHLPFGGTDLDELDLGGRIATTAFLKRFEQLQDLLARAARAMAGWEGVSAVMTHRDVADWFEKHGMVEDAEDWMVAVRLRNRLVHEYPIEEEEQVRRLNESWSLMPLLRAVADRLIEHARNTGIAA